MRMHMRTGSSRTTNACSASLHRISRDSAVNVHATARIKTASKQKETHITPYNQTRAYMRMHARNRLPPIYGTYVTYTQYRTANEPQMRMHTRKLTLYMSVGIWYSHARVHAHLQLVVSSVAHI